MKNQSGRIEPKFFQMLLLVSFVKILLGATANINSQSMH